MLMSSEAIPGVCGNQGEQFGCLTRRKCGFIQRFSSYLKLEAGGGASISRE